MPLIQLFLSFLRNGTLREKWIRNIHRDYFEVHDKTVACIHHFEDKSEVIDLHITEHATNTLDSTYKEFHLLFPDTNSVSNEMVSSTLPLLMVTNVFVLGTSQTTVPQALPVKMQADIISSLANHHRSKCVSLMFMVQPGMWLEWYLVLVERELSSLGYLVVVVDGYSTSMNETLSCRSNRPLIVIENLDGANGTLFTAVPEVRWLVFLQGNTTVNELLRTVNIPFDCEFLVAVPGSEDFVEFHEVYRLNTSLPLENDHWGTWSSIRGLDAPFGGLYSRRNNLHGIMIRAAMCKDDPFESLEWVNGSLKIDGLFPALWLTLGKKLNFTTQFTEAPESAFGSLNPDGSWSGMIGMILDGQVDVSINSFMMTTERSSAVDFTVPIVTTKICVFLNAGDTKRSNWESFHAPFSSQLWIALATIILVSAGALTLVRRRTGSFFSSASFIWSLFCNQGSIPVPQSPSYRLVVFFAASTAVVVCAHYSANSTALLAVSSDTLPFTTLQGLLEDGTFELGVVENGGMYTSFQSATDLVMQQLFVRYMATPQQPLPKSTIEGFRRVCSGEKYALMTSYDYAMGLINNMPCKVTFLSGASFPQVLSMVLAKNSPYKGVIDHSLREFRRSGVISKLYLDKWQLFMPAEDSPFRQLELIDVFPLLVLLGIGVIFGILIFIIERHAKHQCTQIFKS